MKPEYHRRITAETLENHFSPAALRIIIIANLNQDALRYQINHAHFHYDNNSFAAADAYIGEQRRTVLEALSRRNALLAWQAFGRLTHTVQDFYAHSNYVDLWRECHPQAAPDQIHPLLAELLTDSCLRSGRLYYPFEALGFIPALEPLITPLFPRNSHAWMNKDHAGRPNFDYAYVAAVKRTEMEFERLVMQFQPELAILFMDRA